jgi:hypothetical protein
MNSGGIGLLRTGTTDLTDSELQVMDCLFDSPYPASALYRSDYRETFNSPCPHSLSNDDVDFTLSSLRKRGLLEETRYDRYDGSSGVRYGLSSHGGKLWEIERAPPWDLYCNHLRSIPEKDELYEVDVLAFSPQKGEEYFAALIDGGEFSDVTPEHPVWGDVEGAIFRWKRDPPLLRARFSARIGPGPYSFRSLNRWWHSLTQLRDIQAQRWPRPEGRPARST